VKRAALAVLVLVLPGGAPAASMLPSALAFSRAETVGGGVFVLERSGRTRLVAAGGRAPAWSPDGRRLAFVAPSASGATDLYVVDADGHRRTRLVDTPGVDEASPDWSPDGRRLVVESAGWLNLVRADGARMQRLVAGREPAWSPAGGRIAFVGTRAGNDDLYLVGANGRGLRRVTTSPGLEAEPAWSPDGRRLAYVSNENGVIRVHVLDLRRGTVTPVTDGLGDDRSPAWTPDGRRIAFASTRAATDALLAAPSAGGPTVVLGGPAAVDRLRFRPGASPELRPDLDQRAPFDLSLVKRDGPRRRRFLLGFGSATDNLGLGPVSIVASRSSRGSSTMQAAQRVRLAGGGARTYPRVGFLRYDVSPSHTHWHLMDFQRYELRRADDHSLVIRDRKSGFCLTDRWTHRVATGLPGQPRRPRFTTYCGQGNTGALHVGQGTSVGYSDLYPAHFHGQNLDVTRVPAGIYVLVHRANPELLLRELRYENNAASLRIRLSWPRGRAHAPAIRILAICRGSARCPPSS
jgi:hypothetical protein